MDSNVLLMDELRMKGLENLQVTLDILKSQCKKYPNDFVLWGNTYTRYTGKTSMLCALGIITDEMRVEYDNICYRFLLGYKDLITEDTPDEYWQSEEF